MLFNFKKMNSINIFCYLICICSFILNYQVFSQPNDSIKTKYSIPEIINLALDNSKIVQNLYLNKEYQNFELRTQEGKFKPVLTVGSTLGTGQEINKAGDNSQSFFANQLGLSLSASMKVNTGATISYSWQGAGNLQNNSVNDNPGTSENSINQNGSLSVIQPILKGAGTDINMATIQIARLNDSINIQYLRSSFINSISNIISLSRTLIMAEKQLQISYNSVETAKELKILNEALVKLGTIAETDLIQNESMLTYSDIQVLESQNSIENARLSLINLLDLSPMMPLSVLEEEFKPYINIDTSLAFSTALLYNPDYLTSEYELKIAEIRNKLAKDNMLIDLSAFGKYDNSTNNYIQSTSANNWQLGLSLSYTFNDLYRDQLYEQTSILVEEAKNNLIKTKLDIKLSIINSIKDVQLRYKKFQIAKKLKELSEKKLMYEKEKYKIGKSSTFQIVSFQNDLVSANTNEVFAGISYLNSLTQLDRTIGTTLETYKIVLKISK